MKKEGKARGKEGRKTGNEGGNGGGRSKQGGKEWGSWSAANGGLRDGGLSKSQDI